MSDDALAKRTLAFSPERMRAALWQNLAIPETLLDEAVSELRSQIKATKVEYFAWHGEVVDKKVVKDNAARLSAIDKVLAITGSYVKERDINHREADGVVIEIGEDGVHRIIIGGKGAPQALPPGREVLDVDIVKRDVGEHGPDSSAVQETALEVHRIGKHTPRENVIQMFKDPEPDTDGNGSIK